MEEENKSKLGEEVFEKGMMFTTNGNRYLILRHEKIKIPPNSKDGEMYNFMYVVGMNDNEIDYEMQQLFIGSIDADGNPNVEIYDDERYAPYVAGKLAGLTEEQMDGFILPEDEDI